MKTATTIISFHRITQLVFLLVFVLIVNDLHAQETQLTIPDPLKVGFETGDAAAISVYLRESLEVELLNQAGMFSRVQTEKLLHDFFVKNKVDRFTVQRTGNTGSAGNLFTICEIISGQHTFRVYFVRSKINSTYLIHSLSVTKI